MLRIINISLIEPYSQARDYKKDAENIRKLKEKTHAKGDTS